MKRKPSSKSQSSAAAVLSAGVFLASGASAQAPGKVQPMSQKAPAAPQGATQALPAVQKPAGNREAAAYTIKFAGNFMKWRGSLSVAGMLNGRPVFKTAQGEFFQVEPNTGDLQFHSPESLGFIKIRDARAQTPTASLGRAATFLKFDGIKGEQRISVAGVDAQGHVIQENARGERFYLNPMGDMVFVK
ncbi:hypothetical protein [Geothrix campi]|uniref:hypothetical protein n=1 Tax=Geothrix campi TaxID=2966450 RepID=UPI0021474DE1|nr:hypothetical protein [Geothrix sp. SG10]